MGGRSALTELSSQTTATRTGARDAEPTARTQSGGTWSNRRTAVSNTRARGRKAEDAAVRHQEGTDHQRPVKATPKENISCSCGVKNDGSAGPVYLRLGCASSLEQLARQLAAQTGLLESQVRLEKIKHTGREGKTDQGCPIAKWVIRRRDASEQLLAVVKRRPGHRCPAAWTVVLLVLWDAVRLERADTLYRRLVHRLNQSATPTRRGCGTNRGRTCMCQGLDGEREGASYSFGCSYSMYYNACKFARSTRARKFRLDHQDKELELENELQQLATELAPLYQRVAPTAYNNQHRWRCGTNRGRTCMCQGLDGEREGASYSFGCSYSMYYNACKFARSTRARKFRLNHQDKELELENELQQLATELAPLYQRVAPTAYNNQVCSEEAGRECRLGLAAGRPWSGVTACLDFCAHAHRDVHNIQTGCTVVLTLLKPRTAASDQLPGDQSGSPPDVQPEPPLGSGSDVLQDKQPVPLLDAPSEPPRDVQPAAPPVERSAALSAAGPRSEGGAGTEEDPPFDEQLHVLPLYVMDDAGEDPMADASSRGVQRLTSFPVEIREREVPLPSCSARKANSRAPRRPAKSAKRDQPPTKRASVVPGSSQGSESAPPTWEPGPASFSPEASVDGWTSGWVSSAAPAPTLFPNAFWSGESAGEAAQSACWAEAGAGDIVPSVRETADADHAYTLPVHQLPLTSHRSEAETACGAPGWQREAMRRTACVSQTAEGVRLYHYRSDCAASFNDDAAGGVAVALTHGSLLFECAVDELHATTALRLPDRRRPARLALVFYQHRSLQQRRHGWLEREQREQRQ
ncbi:DNA N6-methyl adenine demethylase-like, partial [Pollicipes pollicipes]|uniref:DNA N6-methyl adenine demethylase-like n=1 Tax=Pollicipes pollicipes TaxID=41117 RepID=UPI001884EACA